MLLHVITYIADILPFCSWIIAGEMEILEHMKTLKEKGNNSNQENNPPAHKVTIIIVLKYLAFSAGLNGHHSYIHISSKDCIMYMYTAAPLSHIHIFTYILFHLTNFFY